MKIRGETRVQSWTFLASMRYFASWRYCHWLCHQKLLDWLIFDRSCLPRIEEKLQLSRQDKVCYRYRESFKPFTKSNKDTCSLFALGLKFKSKQKKQYFIFSFFFSYEDIMKWVQTRYAGIHFNQFNRDDFIWDNLPVMWTMLFKPTIENPTR